MTLLDFFWEIPSEILLKLFRKSFLNFYLDFFHAFIPEIFLGFLETYLSIFFKNSFNGFIRDFFWNFFHIFPKISSKKYQYPMEDFRKIFLDSSRNRSTWEKLPEKFPGISLGILTVSSFRYVSVCLIKFFKYFSWFLFKYFLRYSFEDCYPSFLGIYPFPFYGFLRGFFQRFSLGFQPESL